MDDGFLITLVQGKTFLYAKGRSDYMDKMKKENGWKEISEELNCTVDAVKLRWKSLREKYGRERKEKKGRSGAGQSQKRTWDLLPAMAFLEPHLTQRNHTTLDSGPSQDTQDEDDEARVQIAEYAPFEASMVIDGEEDAETADEPDQPSAGQALQTPVGRQLPITSVVGFANFNSPSPTPSEARKRSTDSSAVTAVLSSIANKLQDKKPEDADEVFGRLVAQELRQCQDAESKKLAKRKIMEIIYNL